MNGGCTAPCAVSIVSVGWKFKNPLSANKAGEPATGAHKKSPRFLRGELPSCYCFVPLSADLLLLQNDTTDRSDHPLQHEVTVTNGWIRASSPLSVIRRSSGEGGSRCNKHGRSSHRNKELLHNAPPFLSSPQINAMSAGAVANISKW